MSGQGHDLPESIRLEWSGGEAGEGAGGGCSWLETVNQVEAGTGVVALELAGNRFGHTGVAFGPANTGLSGSELEERVNFALGQVKMREFADRPPHHLSFGQRRRVAVATVLAMKPDILVLDEPSSNLDPASRRELSVILLSLDVTILMVTHDLPYALEICPRAAILNGGKIVADGTTRDLLADEDLMKRNRLELPFGMHLDHIPHHR